MYILTQLSFECETARARSIECAFKFRVIFSLMCFNFTCIARTWTSPQYSLSLRKSSDHAWAL